MRVLEKNGSVSKSAPCIEYIDLSQVNGDSLLITVHNLTSSSTGAFAAKLKPTTPKIIDVESILIGVRNMIQAPLTVEPGGSCGHACILLDGEVLSKILF